MGELVDQETQSSMLGLKTFQLERLFFLLVVVCLMPWLSILLCQFFTTKTVYLNIQVTKEKIYFVFDKRSFGPSCQRQCLYHVSQEAKEEHALLTSLLPAPSSFILLISSQYSASGMCHPHSGEVTPQLIFRNVMIDTPRAVIH